jgi:4'-phosphopantetheinyl transferase EntD
MLQQILPAEVAATEAFEDQPGAMLFREEQAVIARAVGKRRREFITARACAHAALARLGVPPVPILPGAGGAPQWPPGVVGSITHCAGYRAAAVASTRDAVSLGLDAEPDGTLPDGVLDIVTIGAERVQFAELMAAAPGVSWDRLLFSAKESVYKAWFPLTQRWLGFEDAQIVIDPKHGTFTAHLLVPGPLVAGAPLTTLHGRWLTARGLVLTAILVAARPSKAATA